MTITPNGIELLIALLLAVFVLPMVSADGIPVMEEPEPAEVRDYTASAGQLQLATPGGTGSLDFSRVE